jgi:hypothetical protein
LESSSSPEFIKPRIQKSKQGGPDFFLRGYTPAPILLLGCSLGG